MAATFAGMPVLSRRKSTVRYLRAWPPPRCHEVTSPWSFRPPLRFFDSVSDFSGVSLVISLLSSMVRKRRAGVYGLNVFSAIHASSLPKASLRKPLKLQILRVFDHLFAGRQFHVGLFPVATKTFGASPAAEFAVK